MSDRSKDVPLNMASKKQPSRVPATAFDPIAAALQQIHSKVTDETIPDDFMRLLDLFDVSDNKQ